MYEDSNPAKEAEDTTEIVRKLCERFEEMEMNIKVEPKENIDRVAWKEAEHREAYEEYEQMMKEIRVRLIKIGEKTGFRWKYEHEWKESTLTEEGRRRKESEADARDEYEYTEEGRY